VTHVLLDIIGGGRKQKGRQGIQILLSNLKDLKEYIICSRDPAVE
jgi:hypothetical protein